MVISLYATKISTIVWSINLKVWFANFIVAIYFIIQNNKNRVNKIKMLEFR